MSRTLHLTRREVQQIIPHRDPILLVDEALVLKSERKVRTTYHVDPGLTIFAGHFPGYPVFPGAYTLESMGQAAALIALSLPQYQGRLPLFFGANTVRFFKPVLPDDTLEIRAELVEENEAKSRLTVWTEAFVGDTKVSNAEILLAMR